MYGYPTSLLFNDKNVTRVNEFIDRASEAFAPGRYLVEFFTWMKYLPVCIAPWKRNILEWHTSDSEFFMKLFDDAQKRVVSAHVTVLAL